MSELLSLIVRLQRQATKYNVQVVIDGSGLWMVCNECEEEWKVDLSDLEERQRMPNGIYSCAVCNARVVVT